jgi:hypothetical protein
MRGRRGAACTRLAPGPGVSTLLLSIQGRTRVFCARWAVWSSITLLGVVAAHRWLLPRLAFARSCSGARGSVLRMCLFSGHLSDALWVLFFHASPRLHSPFRVYSILIPILYIQLRLDLTRPFPSGPRRRDAAYCPDTQGEQTRKTP